MSDPEKTDHAGTDHSNPSTKRLVVSITMGTQHCTTRKLRIQPAGHRKSIPRTASLRRFRKAFFAAGERQLGQVSRICSILNLIF
jgi:hypothetical protein